eukprot:CAMPEP_0117426742 /NCGR_PEP_ID=MMETSP0758-20121206/6773_1 /TAXON_ID=63605 /ORGANISM="Percolomonas cosmopolitus, Strain AE-1 (ATCC 50343)" /LENGTH=754 /DNA_ID=CAMNT_0005212049 /DNA_START=77 /DNA_END=2337 /DNA_ORIENTATION=+
MDPQVEEKSRSNSLKIDEHSQSSQGKVRFKGTRLSNSNSGQNHSNNSNGSGQKRWDLNAELVLGNAVSHFTDKHQRINVEAIIEHCRKSIPDINEEQIKFRINKLKGKSKGKRKRKSMKANFKGIMDQDSPKFHRDDYPDTEDSMSKEPPYQKKRYNSDSNSNYGDDSSLHDLHMNSSVSHHNLSINQDSQSRHNSVQTEPDPYVHNLLLENEALRNHIEKLQNEAKNNDIAFQQREVNYTKEKDQKERVMISYLLKYGELLRTHEKQQLDQRIQQIGHLKIKSQGVKMVDIWVPGAAYAKIDQKGRRIQQEQTKVSDQKKLIANLKRKLAKKNYSGLERIQKEQEISELEQQNHAYSTELKRRIRNYKHEKETLDQEKNSLVLEIKRVRHQTSSRFLKSNPVLNDRYVLIRLLGVGGFSEVFQAYDVVDCITVALKYHHIKSDWGKEAKEKYVSRVARECETQSNINHPNIVKVYEVFLVDDNTIISVLEYIPFDLDKYIKEYGAVSERMARSIVSQVITALKYMNDQPKKVIHYDLKPGNILMQNDVVKITDFGLCKVYEGSDSIELTSQFTGTYWYLPPETFYSDRVPKISSKVDVWSTGIIFFQMIYGHRPFGQGQTQQQLLHNSTILKAKEVTFPQKRAISKATKDFIRLCLQTDPKKRPDVHELYENPYLRKDPFSSSFKDEVFTPTSPTPPMTQHPIGITAPKYSSSNMALLLRQPSHAPGYPIGSIPGSRNPVLSPSHQASPRFER